MSEWGHTKKDYEPSRSQKVIYVFITSPIIAMTYDSLSNNWQLNFSFNALFKLAAKERKLCIIGPLWVESTCHFRHKGSAMQQAWCDPDSFCHVFISSYSGLSWPVMSPSWQQNGFQLICASFPGLRAMNIQDKWCWWKRSNTIWLLNLL